MSTILVTNDDGIDSPGLKALCRALGKIGKVFTVAPDRDNSAVSHSLTMNRPLRVKKLGVRRHCIDGTPADCVAIALHKLVKSTPDILVSGINSGPNIGDDISYSGTVSAALEGTMYSIPSMAVSLAGKGNSYKPAAEIATKIAALILKKGLPENTLLNVNIPSQQKMNGTRVTRQGRRLWHNSIQEMLDPWGEKYFWIGGGTPTTDSTADTDVFALENGYVSVTPIHLDKTNHEGLIHFRQDWQFENII